MPPFDSLKATLPIFQKPALASGDVATPRSPIPPARASGEIRRKGTAEVTTFNLSCAFKAVTKPHENTSIAVSFRAVGLINDKSLVLILKNPWFGPKEGG